MSPSPGLRQVCPSQERGPLQEDVPGVLGSWEAKMENDQGVKL